MQRSPPLSQLLLSFLFIFSSYGSLAQHDFSGEWSGWLKFSDNSVQLRFTVNFRSVSNTMKGPARLEWPSGGVYLLLATGNGNLTNIAYDGITAQLNRADISYDLSPSVDPGTNPPSDMSAWRSIHFTGITDTSNNGYEMNGAWSHGTFYLRKNFSLNQLLSRSIAGKLTDWLKQGEFETATDYGIRTSQGKRDTMANEITVGFFRQYVGGKGLVMSYDMTNGKFSVNPVIGNPFIVNVPIQQAACFKKQFPAWAQDNLKFTWSMTTRIATPVPFDMVLDCGGGSYIVHYN